MSSVAAQEVSTRITKVTVFEDRADVTREGEVTLSAGASVLVLRGVSALVSDAHVVAHLAPLDATVAEMNVNDVRVVRVMVSEPDPQAARRRTQREGLRALELAVADAEEMYKRETTRRANAEVVLKRWLDQLSAAVGRGQGGAASQWNAQLAALEAELTAADRARADARDALVEARRVLAATAADARESPLPQRLVADLHVRTSGAAGRYRLVVRTLLPCAAWRPTHEATLRSAKDGATSVRFTTHATVWQHTGEMWKDVEVVLSTARPSSGAELPPLRADRLTMRTKTAEERRTIVVEHRDEDVPQTATQGSAPGVDDGGEARTFRAERMTVKSDGRPHRAQVATFDAPCRTERIAVPELAPQVFLRASLKNAGSHPILAGPVTLALANDGAGGAFVGTGDVTFCGVGEDLDLSFGSDDRFLVRTRKRRVDDKKIVGKDLVHFVREATLTQSTGEPTRVTVLMRLPVSELKQLRVIQSPQHGTEGELKVDEHGLVRVPVELKPHTERKVAVAFTFDASGDVRIPDPW